MKYITCYCPICNKETLHNIYIKDIWTNEKSSIFDRILCGVCTVGLGLMDMKRVCECMDCGNIKNEN